MRAYAALAPTVRKRYPLVIVGARGWLNADLETVLGPLEANGSARRLGYVSEDVLPLIYAGAHGFAFPSLYEGFGLPVLEAMASGIPVLTSNVSSMPEVGADIALGVDPLDEDALRSGLETILEDEPWRRSAIERGALHARQFPWSRCVDETVAVYKQISGEAG